MILNYLILMFSMVVSCFVSVLSVAFGILQLLWLTFCTAMVGYAPEGPFKAWLNRKVSIMCFGILSSALSSVITYHGKENMPKNGICVANHTSPIDVLMLMCDNCYSLVGLILIICVVTCVECRFSYFQ